MLKRYYNRAIIFGRGDSMRKIDKGFSLVELLIVVIIIGILAGILYLVVGPSDDMVREKACGGNRATIMLALDGYRFSNGLNKENYTLQSFIDDKYKDTISNNEVKCPSGGIYSAGEENGREKVICSVHSVPSGGGGPVASNYIPWTSTFGNPGIPPNSTWPTPEYNSNGTVVNQITLPTGSTYAYVNSSGETEFYVVGAWSNVVFGRNKYAVTPDAVDPTTGNNIWGATEIIKVSSREAVKWSDVTASTPAFGIGDVVYHDATGKYYIARGFGNISNAPGSSGNWVEIK